MHNSLVTVGKLDLEIVECTRIPKLPKGSHIYCSLSLDILPWKEDMPMKRSLWPIHEVKLFKLCYSMYIIIMMIRQTWFNPNLHQTEFVKKFLLCFLKLFIKRPRNIFHHFFNREYYESNAKTVYSSKGSDEQNEIRFIGC